MASQSEQNDSGIEVESHIDVEGARRIQLELAGKVVRHGNPLPDEIRLIAGVDASISKNGLEMIGSIALFRWPDLILFCLENCTSPVVFPYIPGYLSFRELPVLLKTFERLPEKPDLVLVDGHGIAHPRRLGIASHFGVVTGCITIGCAKRRLTGECGELALERGDYVTCVDHGETIGSVVRTRTGVSPVWVSTGHRIELKAAIEWILCTTRGYRLPEPIRAAHNAASRLRKKI